VNNDDAMSVLSVVCNRAQSCVPAAVVVLFTACAFCPSQQSLCPLRSVQPIKAKVKIELSVLALAIEKAAQWPLTC